MNEPIGAGIVGQDREGLTGVRGWLLVFIVWTFAVGIGGSVVGVSKFLSGGLPQIDDATAGIYLAAGGMSLLDAILILLHKRLAKFLSITIFSLIAFFCLASIMAGVIGLMPTKFDEVAGSARGLVIAVLWLGYFLRSKRVDYTLTN